ncbi:glutamate ligase domain-containing protein [Mechercharimyces sp. CAU 1602]|uniref:glutamate ligase domain-containing protein n=1 Tax=Mechercharimyces sp. CAU 1602 TaxID=2973933 RepID=UPI0021620664|nr:cyanophycin synthetase [Mechercharimyces sp. CAU 1602]MCS1351192.1 hypothetical protein [Mechercharimyces sp. CAU 1602]
MQPISAGRGRLLINDAWNASPSSMKAGMEVFAQIAPHRPAIAVLGDMLELGAHSSYWHKHIGKMVATMPLYRLVTVGTHAKKISDTAIQNGFARNRVIHFQSSNQVASYLARVAPEKAAIYFKASRKFRFENIIRSLLQRHN